MAEKELTDIPEMPNKGVPLRLVKEAQLLHDCLKERGHLNINELLSFLQKVITARAPLAKNKKPKTRAAKRKEELFLYHLERLSKTGKKIKS